MNKPSKYILIALLVFAAFWLFMVVKTSNDEAHVRIAHHKDQALFEHVEKFGGPEPKINPDQIVPIAEVMNKDSIDAFAAEGYQLQNYAAYLHYHDLLLFRKNSDLNPALMFRPRSNLIESSYDPTNGTYSEGFSFRLLKLETNN